MCLCGVGVVNYNCLLHVSVKLLHCVNEVMFWREREREREILKFSISLWHIHQHCILLTARERERESERERMEGGNIKKFRIFF